MSEPEQSSKSSEIRIETGQTPVPKESDGSVSVETVEAGLRREADQKLAALERDNNTRAAEAGVDIDTDTRTSTDTDLEIGGTDEETTPLDPAEEKKNETLFGSFLAALVSAKDGIWGFLEKIGIDIRTGLEKFFGAEEGSDLDPDQGTDSDGEHDTDFSPDRMFPNWEKALENPDAPVFSFPRSATVDVTDVKRYREHHTITGKGRWHRGYDIGVPEGTPIVATKKGKIISSYYNKHIDPDTGREDGGGWLVTLRTEDGREHKFMHLQEQGLTKNTLVVPGMLLGMVGQTGGATGPHLHYEVWNQGEPEEPMAYLSADLQVSAMDERKNKGLPPLT